MMKLFSEFEDPLIQRSRRHKLIDIIVIGIVGAICGAENWEDMEMIAEEKEVWLRPFLELPNGVPSHDTLSRVFARISASEFERSFREWMKDVAALTDGEVIAIDGNRLHREIVDRFVDRF